MTRAAELRAILGAGSKSFSLASLLLPAEQRDAAAAVYAFCRRCDNAIDDAPRARQPAALARLRAELAAIYAGERQTELALAAFQEVARACRIPRDYPEELVEGMRMDVEGRRYRRLDDLALYGYRVAGTVGLMMGHVIGVDRDGALRHAVHLGIALQFTNIARDVADDWRHGRIYLPDEYLGEEVAERLHRALGGPLPDALAGAVAGATVRLLDAADGHYRAADEGFSSLPLRSAAAIRGARWIYWGIGAQVASRGGDPRRGRAVVPLGGKLRLLGRAMAIELRAAPRRLLQPSSTGIPRVIYRPGDLASFAMNPSISPRGDHDLA